MDRVRGRAPAHRRAGSPALTTAIAGLFLAGCHTTSAASPGQGHCQHPAERLVRTRHHRDHGRRRDRRRSVGL